HSQCWTQRISRQTHLRKAARLNLVVGVIQLQLDEQRARVRCDRLRRVPNFRLNRFVYWFRKKDVNRLAYLDITRVPLRNAKVNPKWVRLLDMKHLEARVVRDDQVSDVCVSSGDDACKRGGHSLEGHLLFQHPQVSGVSIGVCLARSCRGGLFLRVEL